MQAPNRSFGLLCPFFFGGRSAHWNPVTVPEAVKVNDAVCLFIFVFTILVLDGDLAVMGGGVNVGVMGGGMSVKVAVITVAEFTVTVQVVPPLQPGPLRLAVDPDAGIAVSVTGVPYA